LYFFFLINYSLFNFQFSFLIFFICDFRLLLTPDISGVRQPHPPDVPEVCAYKAATGMKRRNKKPTKAVRLFSGFSGFKTFKLKGFKSLRLKGFKSLRLKDARLSASPETVEFIVLQL
jgi:hypothetical protein